MIWKDFEKEAPKEKGYYVLWTGYMNLIKCDPLSFAFFKFCNMIKLDEVETPPEMIATYYWRELTPAEQMRLVANEI